MQLRHDRRRPVTIVLLLGMLGSLGMLFTPAAQASWCTAPSQVGNVAFDAGLTAVAVSQDNIGNPDAYTVYACSDPAGQYRVTLTNHDPGRPGQQVSTMTCVYFAGCTMLNSMGVEVGVPSTTVDLPNDGNNRVGAAFHTGPGVCTWMGSETCQLGGGTYSASQPVNELPPDQDDMDAVNYAADWPNRCLYYIGWAGVDFGIFFCTWDGQNVPFFLIGSLTT